ncbi:SapC family protein [Roseovarius autotrophicus]|uniref:SapC family protein n=1 Tax=Roseovarius autotrophicus TaxID=2824121 RepID=UPI0019F40570|nr:SapC family protein [Roseovarius autotrophicus]MBE0452529.1 SapC family protein [Roseovarius sp.]
MATQLLFYERATPVTAKAHGDVSVRSSVGYGFSRKVNSVPLTAVEFAAAAAHYPIVFAGAEDRVMPAVILGARSNENFFVDEAGKWRAGTYVPAFVRRYPFVFSTDRDGRNFILNIDETYEGVNRDGRGERLFDSDGNQTVYLQNILRFLQEYQGQFRRTEAYCKRLKDLDLLQPMQAQFSLPDGERRSLSGFMALDREKLKAIKDADLRAMFDTDELECTFLHLFSMRHFQNMVEHLATPAPEAAADADAGASPAQEPADT